MYPIQMQAGSRGIGMGYNEFVTQFEAICQEHLQEERAQAFAFLFYDMANGMVRRALREGNGFRLLHEKTGRDITLFYLHDQAVDAHWRSFNQRFMSTLGIEDQAKPPCMVFFRVHAGNIEDVSIYRIDEKSTDPILIVAELEQYVDDAIKQLKAEGDVSALTDVGKLIAPIGSLIKVGEFLLKLRVAP